ncbi:hypothetical protein QN277_012499 [Acacia crassicarpa]|uniref:rRNA methyltransferase 1, mitochondrial n=1 Tax=Acacia crassicarpa TaxID=499986 RepID=A0AAE1N143_9FABA|nr:hypothetical protein QN277_012499 [Acacia crassicarpa]
MYTNLTRAQGFPRVAKISPGSKCFQSSHDLKTQCLPFCFAPKPSQNPMLKNPNFYSRKAKNKIGSFCLMNPVKHSTDLLLQGTLEMGKLVSSRHVSFGLLLKISGQYCLSLRPRSFSSSYAGKVNERISVVRAGKELPWLASNKVRGAREPGKTKMTNIRGSIHEELPKKEKKFINSSSGEESLKRSGKLNSRSSWEESIQRLENSTIPESEHSPKGDISAAAIKESRNGSIEMVGEQRSDYGGRHGNLDDDDETEEAIDDPRWDNIKNRFRGLVRGRAGSERPELQRWNKQDNWGRKTWKEATQSTVPKIVGEEVYGVGPVLAALSAGRREFYALYVQEGLDLSSNNRKKKDKKGFERLLKIAEKIGLSVKEISKHDLNMLVDNRPHQGLVLDASPLEMVKIKELDPISIEEGRDCLWVALDEVTDPQNLGAIIRSAYYFGASGIVLCAKNSAPLSGVVSKASAGSLELMELRYCKNMMQFLVSSSENGWRVLGGSVSSKAVSLDEIVPGPPTVLVLGSEGTGLRPLVEKSCTHLVRIPGNIPVDLTASELDGETTGLNNGEISGREFQSFLAVESLNVSVAAGVLLHHLIGKKLEASLPYVCSQSDAHE